MEEAIRIRKQARIKVLEYFDSKSNRRALGRSQLQELLDERWSAGLQVIRLAVRRKPVSAFAQASSQVQGEFISDFSLRAKGRLGHEHLAVEIGTLFQDCVYRPTRAARRALSQGSPKNVGVLRQKIQVVVDKRLGTFYALADEISHEMLRLRNDVRADQKLRCYRAALVQALYSISDMSRYVRDFRTACAIIQLSRCVEPEASVPHGKLAIVSWQDLSSFDDNLATMYQFCAELVKLSPVVMNEDLPAGKFVTYIRGECARPSSRNSRANRRKLWFVNNFLSLAWRLVESQEAVDTAPAYVRDDSLWETFGECMEAQEGSVDYFREDDLLFVVAILMYARHRVSPLGCSSGALQQPRALAADSLICDLVVVLCEHAQREIETIASAASKRRKRKKQKERKNAPGEYTSGPTMQDARCSLARTDLERNRNRGHCGALTSAERADLIRDLDVYSDVLEKVPAPRVLGPLSALTHFWSKSINIPPNHPVAPYQEVVKRIDSVIRALDVLSTPVWLTMLFGRVASSVSETSKMNGLIPALKEDVFFANFPPCYSRRMLDRKRVHQVRVHDLLHGSPEGAVSRAASLFRTSSFEDIVGEESQKDLVDFSERLISEELDLGNGVGQLTTSNPPNNAVGIDVMKKRNVQTVSALVSMAIRKHGIMRLYLALSKHDGGRLVLQSPETPVDAQICSPLVPPTQCVNVSHPELLELNRNGPRRVASSPKLPLAKRRRIAAADSLQRFPLDSPANGRTLVQRGTEMTPKEAMQTVTTPVLFVQRTIEMSISECCDESRWNPVPTIYDAVRASLYGSLADAKHASVFKRRDTTLSWRKRPHEYNATGNPFLITATAKPPLSAAQNTPSESLSASG